VASALLDAVRPSLRRFGAHALTTTVWALARLRCRPSPGWWEDFFARSHALLPLLSGQQFANVTWALYRWVGAAWPPQQGAPRPPAVLRCLVDGATRGAECGKFGAWCGMVALWL